MTDSGNAKGEWDEAAVERQARAWINVMAEEAMSLEEQMERVRLHARIIEAMRFHILVSIAERDGWLFEVLTHRN